LLVLAPLSFFLVYLSIKNIAAAMIARPATPPTAPPTMAPIGVLDEEGAGAALVVGPTGAVVVGEPPLPL
jgi:hypothetical protein